jgi:hypothetical protein
LTSAEDAGTPLDGSSSRLRFWRKALVTMIIPGRDRVRVRVRVKEKG